MTAANSNLVQALAVSIVSTYLCVWNNLNYMEVLRVKYVLSMGKSGQIIRGNWCTRTCRGC